MRITFIRLMPSRSWRSSVVYHMFDEILKTDVYALSDAEKIDVDIDGFHEVMRRLSQKYRFLYGRRKIDVS